MKRQKTIEYPLLKRIPGHEPALRRALRQTTCRFNFEAHLLHVESSAKCGGGRDGSIR